MSWTCPNCGTQVESEFTVCWNCGTDIHGRVDDEFSVESDPDELADEPETPRIRCLQCGYRGKVLFSTRDKTWWEWLLSGLVSILVSQRSWIHFCHQFCPKCDAPRNRLVPWSGDYSPSAEEIWSAAFDEESRLARRRRRLIYLVLGALAVASLILWWSLK